MNDWVLAFVVLGTGLGITLAIGDARKAIVKAIESLQPPAADKGGREDE